MDENLNPTPEPEVPADSCISCGSSEILPGYPNKLCPDCRKGLINFPIPLWVKLFGAGVVVVMLISLIWLPGNLGAAVALSHAEKAEEAHNYLTAQRELEKARKVAPKSVDVLGNLVVAAYNNNDLATSANAADQLTGRSVEDSALLGRVNVIVDQFNLYMPSDSLKTVISAVKSGPVPDSIYEHYIKIHPGDVFAEFSLASNYADENKYGRSDKLLSTILYAHPNFLGALNMKPMVKRELNQIDSSLYYCDQLLALNHQSAYAMAAKARTLLKIRKNREGLQIARQCYQLDSRTPFGAATLALAYHFNNNFKQRDQMLAIAGRDTASVRYVKDIISNKVKFQN